MKRGQVNNKPTNTNFSLSRAIVKHVITWGNRSFCPPVDTLHCCSGEAGCCNAAAAPRALRLPGDDGVAERWRCCAAGVAVRGVRLGGAAVRQRADGLDAMLQIQRDWRSLRVLGEHPFAPRPAVRPTPLSLPLLLSRILISPHVGRSKISRCICILGILLLLSTAPWSNNY